MQQAMVELRVFRGKCCPRAICFCSMTGYLSAKQRESAQARAVFRGFLKQCVN